MKNELSQVSIQLLGPMTADLDHHPVAPTAGKQRQTLALLALNRGRVVTVATLVEELWGDCPPRSYATTLQTYILQLRNRLAAAAEDCCGREMLSTRYGGYLLEEDACRTDVDEFGRLVVAGRAASERGDHRTASDQFGQALNLWLGPALVDVPRGPVLGLEAASLEETRLGVLERRIEADLALNRHCDLIGELTLLAARDPMNENFCALLMTALYRCGHISGALEAYQRLRAVLRDDLGVEPCPRVRRVQQAVLSGDPALEPGQVATLSGRRAGRFSQLT
jgi:SARP family transcriptional regulator, regulator of embCAB operon